jgi:hypothetical protein
LEAQTKTLGEQLLQSRRIRSVKRIQNATDQSSAAQAQRSGARMASIGPRRIRKRLDKLKSTATGNPEHNVLKV